MKYQFEEVAVHRTVRGVCSVCGRKGQRKLKFWQTINPLNLGPDGKPKTREAILAELHASADAAGLFVHAKCGAG